MVCEFGAECCSRPVENTAYHLLNNSSSCHFEPISSAQFYSDRTVNSKSLSLTAAPINSTPVSPNTAEIG